MQSCSSYFYCPLDSCGVCSDILSSTNDTGSTCLLFLLVLLEIINFIYLHKKLLTLLIFAIVFLLWISLISPLIWDVFCFPLSSSLRWKQIIDLRAFLFSNKRIECSMFSCKHWLGCTNFDMLYFYFLFSSKYFLISPEVSPFTQ